MDKSSTNHAPLAEAYSLALQLFHAQDIGAAIAACRIILQANPLQAETLLLLGVAHLQLGENQSALAELDLALRARPGWPEAHFNRGLALRDLARFEEAVASFMAAVAGNQEWAEAWLNLGDALESVGQLDEALSAYDHAILLQADHTVALNRRGLVLLDLNRAERALASFDQAITHKPDHARSHNNRGNALLALGCVAEALASYDRALALDASLAEAFYNRGNAQQELLQFDAALSSYRHASELRPDYADAHWNEGLCRLLLGDFVGGWKEYEWRWKLPSNRQREFAKEAQRPWSGKELLAGQTILLYAEQGLGDTLQFCRYAMLVAALGARVSLEVQPGLKPLLANLEGVAQVVASGEDRPAFDFCCSLLSLPGIFETDLASIPARVPYVSVDAGKRSLWSKRLGRKTRKRAGLVWSGSPTHKRDHYRSVPLTMLAPLLDVAGIEFVSLMLDVRESDRQILTGSTIRDFRTDIKDFSDTAALVAQMDLVICVDTSIAHLAGAMNIPVWILLPCVPDWRWLLERADSPWYPSARLFRRSLDGDWSGVVEAVLTELQIWQRSGGPHDFQAATHSERC